MRKDVGSASEVFHSLCSTNLSSPADFPWKKVYSVYGVREWMAALGTVQFSEDKFFLLSNFFLFIINKIFIYVLFIYNKNISF